MPLGAFKAALMGTAGVSTAAEAVVLLHDTDYSGAASASITSGIDSTYGEYIFGFYTINPATDGADFTFQVNASGESGYNETITSGVQRNYHAPSDGSGSLHYVTNMDQAQGTAFQEIAEGIGNDADASCAGMLHLFNPASTTYVKHFYTRMNNMGGGHQYQRDMLISGYINTTAAIDEIQFKWDSGNFDGTIKMWGVL